MLRDYQQRAIDQLYDWFGKGNEGNPCLVLPTGAGKSHIVAALCKDALQNWPETRILMLTHVKELIEQNAEKMREHWMGAPMGIYSSALRKRQLGEPITFAGIQSIRTKASQVGHIDLCIIDECHLVSHKDEGGYRSFLSDLKAINPSMRVVGLTATPYRLGHGMITEGSALFHAIIEPVTIEELIHKGHLSTLRSKFTKTSFDTSGVHKRGGEFIESELQAAVDTAKNNLSVVEEVIEWAGDRKAWLFFCTGVEHAQNVADTLNAHGIEAECVTGTTPKAQRERILRDFKAGKIRALTNANVLTTGFDYPDIDLIAMLRPTMSASLYVQMAGRGMRIKSHTGHCLVLDFARVVQTHGPITAINPGKPKGEGTGEAPVKACLSCDELVPISARVCPNCGEPFPISEPPKLMLHQDDIMGLEGTDMSLTGWQWRKHISRTSGKEMLAVTYYGALSDPSVVEYLTVTHDGIVGDRAMATFYKIARRAEVNLAGATSLDEWADRLNVGTHPSEIEYRKDGKFYRVLKRSWDNGASA
jgi:DNA repair protein RadD